MFVRMLVNDMGGHGRALEMLVESLQELGCDPDDLEIDLLASKLRLKLQGCYPSWFKVEDGGDLIPVFESALAHQKFTSTNSHISSKFTVEDVVRLGLIRWNRATCMLEVPFILFWLLTTETPNASPVLRRLARDNVSSGIVKRTGLEGWRAWEEFVADFQSLKSKVFDGKEVTLGELHAGAKISDSVAKSLIRVSKKNVVWSTKHYPSRSDGQIVDIIDHEHGEVSFKIGDVVVVNGISDFLCICFCMHGQKKVEFIQIELRKMERELKSEREFLTQKKNFFHNFDQNWNSLLSGSLKMSKSGCL